MAGCPGWVAGHFLFFQTYCVGGFGPRQRLGKGLLVKVVDELRYGAANTWLRSLVDKKENTLEMDTPSCLGERWPTSQGMNAVGSVIAMPSFVG